MAAIRETLILEDKFTSTMTQCLQVAQVAPLAGCVD